MEDIKQRHSMIVRDDEGNAYFLRPEILEATKIPKEALDTLRGNRSPTLEEKSSGVLTIDKELEPDLEAKRILDDLRSKAASTVMCPW